MSQKKRKQRKGPKPETFGKLADKIEQGLKDNPNGNPFKGMKFTQEERDALAEVGCV